MCSGLEPNHPLWTLSWCFRPAEGTNRCTVTRDGNLQGLPSLVPCCYSIIERDILDGNVGTSCFCIAMCCLLTQTLTIRHDQAKIIPEHSVQNKQF